MNKKAIFMPLFVILVLVISAYLSYNYVIDSTNTKKTIIGNISSELYSTYGETELKLFYIEQSAKSSAWQTLKDLSETGFSDFDKNFKLKFNENLNKYLKSENLPINNFDYEISASNTLEITGKAKAQILIEKLDPIKLKYSIYPNFKIQIDYPISNYLGLINQVNLCKGEDICLTKIQGINIQEDFIYIPTTKNLYTDELITIKIQKNPLRT